MSAPINNQFAGGPTVSESFSDSVKEGETKPMTTTDGGGMYASYTPQEKLKNTETSEESEESEDPDDILSTLDEISDVEDNTLISDNDNSFEQDIPGEEVSEEKGEILSANLEAFSEHSVTPVLTRFNKISAEYDLGTITENDCSQIIDKVSADEFNLEKLASVIGEINFDNPEVKGNLKRYISEVQNLNPEKIETTGEQEVEIPEEFKGNELLKDSENDIVQLLAENYIRLPAGEDGKPNFEDDLQTCFETTANKVIEGKQFPRNDAFSLAMNDIKSGDIETQLQALTYISSLVNTNEGRKGGRDKKIFKKISGDHSDKKTDYLDFKTAQLNKQIEESTNGEEKLKLEQQLEALENDKAKEDFPESGEVFAGGELDQATTNI